MLQRLVARHPVSARNFTNSQASTCVESYSTVLQEQYKNAVSVHATKCIYYQKLLHGHTCTCTAHSIGKTENDITVIEPNEVETDYSIPLFGSKSDPILDSKADNIDLDINLGPDTNGMDLFDTSIFNNSVDCGVCYRTGVIPAYVPLSCSRYVFHSHNIETMVGYVVDKKYPDSFSKLTDDGYVEYVLNVPIFFIDVSYTIYNNKRTIDDVVYVNDPLTLSDLQSSAGQQLLFRVKSDNFTHVVLQFRLAKFTNIDFPQDQHSLDVTLFDSLSTVQLVADSSIPSVSSGDVIYNMMLDKYWKVTDYSFFRLNVGKVLGWSITARLIQKDETLLSIGSLKNIG